MAIAHKMIDGYMFERFYIQGVLKVCERRYILKLPLNGHHFSRRPLTTE